MEEEYSNEKCLALAKGLTENLTNNLPHCVEIAVLTLNSKLPFKALTIRETLIHRMAELSTATIQLFESRQLLPAFILTRSTIETAALLYCLYRSLEQFNADHDLQNLDKSFLMRALMGSKHEDATHTAYSVLTAVDKLDKVVEGIRHDYDELSEFLHPNWAGVMGAFGKIDKDNFRLELGKENRTLKPIIGLSPFVAALQAFEIFYNEVGKSILVMNDFFESASS
jgi:hypothetical protein